MRGIEAQPPAVVVGLDCVTGLQTARLLAGRGVPVIALAANPRHFCARSRVPRRVVAAPTQGDGLTRALERLGTGLPGGEPAFLLPCTDGAVLTISRDRERLAGPYRFVLPPHGVIERLMDKVAFAEHARDHGLPIPPTVILRTRSDAEAAAEVLDARGLHVLPGLIDPQVHFREPGGVLFEVATIPPGFTADESLTDLGTSLKLPPWEEGNRRNIEAGLPVVRTS